MEEASAIWVAKGERLAKQKEILMKELEILMKELENLRTSEGLVNPGV